jgi:hypothetical protein
MSPDLPPLVHVSPVETTPCPRCGDEHPGANGHRVAYCDGTLRCTPRIVVVELELEAQR